MKAVVVNCSVSGEGIKEGTCPCCGASFPQDVGYCPQCFHAVPSLRGRRPRTISLADRFWAKVDKNNGDCWLWTAARYRCGYGRFTTVNQVQWPAHRVAYVLTSGPIPQSLFVCHRCDVKLCVRPDHLFLGTNEDNARDCWAKGRNVFQRQPERRPRGVHVKAARLSPEIARDIRQRHAAGQPTLADLACEYRVTRQAVWCIVHRKTWTHV